MNDGKVTIDVGLDTSTFYEEMSSFQNEIDNNMNAIAKCMVSIGDCIGTAANVMGDKFINVLSVTGESIDSMTTKWKELVGEIGSILGNLPNVVGEIISEMSHNVNLGIEKLMSAQKEWGNECKLLFKQTFESLFGIVSEFFVRVSENSSTFAATFTASAKELWQTINSVWNVGISTIKQTFDGLISYLSISGTNVTNTVQNLFEGVAKTISTICKEITLSIKECFTNILTGNNGVLSSISEIGTTLVKNMTQIGGQIVDGLIAGLSGKTSSIKNTISNVANSIVSQFKSILSIHSPSKVMFELGEFIDDGLSDGIASGKTFIMEQVSDMASEIKQTAINTLPDFSAISSEFSALTDSLNLSSIIGMTIDTPRSSDIATNPNSRPSSQEASPLTFNLEYYGDVSSSDIYNVGKLLADSTSRELRSRGYSIL